ncbi:small acid-soluble spore protein O [Aquibacillus halophilus]|uniref:Small acid-soluble spore protein O n=1 Tax=Aquibacillus halophilus TaxID=930132 RepID=A0A6A8DV02_9BACI|nr:small acid-soluble spore protein O [Aquibacillus halophilus]MRH45032.1 small acid-soluble spore protein O [Aquibacillus halophilus]
MGKDIKNKKLNAGPSDEQAIKGELSKKFDHEFANEPLTTNEKHFNKKTKKRQ